MSNNVIQKMEQKYPQMTEEFKRIQEEQYQLFCGKMWNYGTANIALGTNLDTKSDIKLSLTGIWFRMRDKIERLKNLVVLEHVDYVGESSIDTFQDLSVYGILAQIVTSGKWGK
jgi:hypothetical protein